MKAIYFEQHGGLEVLQYGSIPDPELEPGHAIVKVTTCAINHLDIWVRNGGRHLEPTLPHIGGSDIVGELVAIDDGNSSFSPGERVIVNPGLVTQEDEWTAKGQDSVSPGYRIIGEHIRGGMAELVKVPSQNLFKPPQVENFEELSAQLLVGLTSWRMLFVQGQLKPEHIVLIVGAGGGVNSISLQFAHAVGANVIALTSTEEKCALAQQLGANQTINYKEDKPWHRTVLASTDGRGADIIVDNVGAATMPLSLKAACRGGKILTVGNTSGAKYEIDNRYLFTKQLSLIGSTMGSRKDFEDMLAFVEKHKIKPVVDEIAPLSEGIRLIEKMEKGEQFGKLLVKP